MTSIDVQSNAGEPLRTSIRGRKPILLWIVAAYLILDCFTLVSRSYLDFEWHRDTGYPDSAVLLQVSNFAKTGRMYQDLTHPPYVLTMYGPLYFVLLSGPYALAGASGLPAHVLLRIVILASFTGCLWLVFLCARRLTSVRWAGLAAALFAASGPLWGSTTTLRPDYVGLLFVLLGIWLVLSGASRWSLPLAAFCCGLALLSKLTFIAAPAAVLIWLVWRRRFSSAALWAAVVAFTALAGYGVVLLHEPFFRQHMNAMSRTILEYKAALAILLTAVKEPKTLFGLCGAWIVWRSAKPEGKLVILYALFAWIVAVITLPQIGGALNYFYEPWMVTSILAGLALVTISSDLNFVPVAPILLLVLLQLWYVEPRIGADLSELRQLAPRYRDEKRARLEWESVRKVLDGRRILAMSPDISIWSKTPEMPDPFENQVLARRGAWSLEPILHSLENGGYDAVVVPVGSRDRAPDWRGQQLWSPILMAAAESHYAPQCTFDGSEVWLPSHPDLELQRSLELSECKPLPSSTRNLP